jgi:hypothetical protein
LFFSGKKPHLSSGKSTRRLHRNDKRDCLVTQEFGGQGAQD